MRPWTTKRAAEYVGVSPSTINRWVRERGLPCNDEHGERIFYRDSIDAYLRGGERARAPKRPAIAPDRVMETPKLAPATPAVEIRPRTPRVTARELRRLLSEAA